MLRTSLYPRVAKRSLYKYCQRHTTLDHHWTQKVLTQSSLPHSLDGNDMALLRTRQIFFFFKELLTPDFGYLAAMNIDKTVLKNDIHVGNDL